MAFPTPSLINLPPCGHRDARCMAARLVENYLAHAPSSSAFIYGKGLGVTVGLGTVESWSLSQCGNVTRSGKNDASVQRPACPWGDVNSFIERHPDEYIFGYIGFDFHNHGQPSATLLNYPVAHLSVPQCVIRITASELRVLAGDAALLESVSGDVALCRCGQLQTLSANSLDIAPENIYQQSVQSALDWIGKDSQRRLTVARRVPVSLPLDIISSVHCAPSGSAVSRSFYIHAPAIEFAGHSPELLALGDVHQFRSYKLSGTYPRSPDMSIDTGLCEAFIRDPKILNEHALSVRSTEASLLAAGNVTKGAPEVLDLPLIRHRMTAFDIATTGSITVADCLRCAMPSGAYPVREGLDMLRLIEKDARGAYYGMAGLIEPGRKFSFSQILRSVFRDSLGAYVWVGAAVTGNSDPNAEYEETRLKLGSIQLAAALH